jgi:hypothetical protein
LGVTDVTAQTYEVVTKGRLTPPIVCGLAGFDLVRVRDGMSYLVGTIPDQAGLFDMLKVLRDLHVELVSIETVPTDEGARALGRS